MIPSQEQYRWDAYKALPLNEEGNADRQCRSWTDRPTKPTERLFTAKTPIHLFFLIRREGEDEEEEEEEAKEEEEEKPLDLFPSTLTLIHTHGNETI